MVVSDIETDLRTAGQRIHRRAPGVAHAILVRVEGAGKSDTQEWTLELRDGEIQVQPGRGQQAPRVEITAAAATIQALADGTRKPLDAFLAGEVGVRGELSYIEDLVRALA